MSGEYGPYFKNQTEYENWLTATILYGEIELDFIATYDWTNGVLEIKKAHIRKPKQD